MEITITAIMEWAEDFQAQAGDASHVGWRSVQQVLEDERVRKLDNEWTEGLPFTCEAEDIEDALEQYNEKYCECDYLKASVCDWDEQTSV